MLIKMNNQDISELLLSYTRSASFTDYITGNVPTQQLDITFDNEDNLFSYDDLKKAIFEVQQTPGSNKLFFKVYEMPETWDKVIELKLYDTCHDLDVLYNTELAYPTTIQEQLTEMSRKCNIIIDMSNIPENILNREVGWYDSTRTIREHIGWIACLFNANIIPKDYGEIAFEILSKDTFAKYDDVFNYKKGNEYLISKVRFNNGFVLEKGNYTANTYLLDNGNMYISKQEDIDILAPGLIGLSLVSMSMVECEYKDNLHLGHIVDCLGYRFIVKSLTEKYTGGDTPDYELAGELTTSNQEQVGQKISDPVRIKRLQIITNEIDTAVTIMAEQVEENTQDVSTLKVSVESIETEVSKTSNSIYKFESGSGNIFNNCNQLLIKNADETGVKYVNDMPLDINKDYMQGKDICISLDVNVINGIFGDIGNFVGAEFQVGYADGIKKTYSSRWYLGQYDLQYLLQTSTVDHEERIWMHFKLDDKEITSVSNLKMIIALDCEKAIVANPKVEFGTFPTGYVFDVPYVRDNVETIQKDYTVIKQEVSVLTLQAVSMEEQITTIKGDVSEVTTRLESTELKLTPQAITAMVNEQIGADGELKTVTVRIDKNGLDVKNGAISITNKSDVKVLYADTNGNLVGNNIVINNLQSTSGKIGKFTIDDKGFGYSESVSISGQACTFTLEIHPDARSSFLNWKLKTNNGSADEIVGALTYSGLECNTVSAMYVNAAEVYTSSLNTTSLGVSDAIFAGYVNVTSNLRVYGTTNLYDVNISGRGYVTNSAGQAVSMQRIADLVG